MWWITPALWAVLNLLVGAFVVRRLQRFLKRSPGGDPDPQGRALRWLFVGAFLFIPVAFTGAVLWRFGVSLTTLGAAGLVVTTISLQCCLALFVVLRASHRYSVEQVALGNLGIRQENYRFGTKTLPLVLMVVVMLAAVGSSMLLSVK